MALAVEADTFSWLSLMQSCSLRLADARNAVALGGGALQAAHVLASTTLLRAFFSPRNFSLGRATFVAVVAL